MDLWLSCILLVFLYAFNWSGITNLTLLTCIIQDRRNRKTRTTSMEIECLKENSVSGDTENKPGDLESQLSETTHGQDWQTHDPGECSFLLHLPELELSVTLQYYIYISKFLFKRIYKFKRGFGLEIACFDHEAFDPDSLRMKRSTPDSMSREFSEREREREREALVVQTFLGGISELSISYMIVISSLFLPQIFTWLLFLKWWRAPITFYNLFFIKFIFKFSFSIGKQRIELMMMMNYLCPFFLQLYVLLFITVQWCLPHAPCTCFFLFSLFTYWSALTIMSCLMDCVSQPGFGIHDEL